MPVLDLDDFLKRSENRREGTPSTADTQASSAAAPTAGRPAEQTPEAGTGSDSPKPKAPYSADAVLDMSALSARIAISERDLTEVRNKISSIESSAAAAASKAEHALGMFAQFDPQSVFASVENLKVSISYLNQYKEQSESKDRALTNDILELKSRLSALSSTSLADGQIPPQIGLSLQKMENEMIGLSARLRPLEIVSEHEREWADREKDYFVKIDQAVARLTEVERKTSSKDDMLPEDYVSKIQFDKYSRMVDLDRQQLRASIDDFQDTVNQLSASFERLSGMFKSSHRSSGPTGSLEPITARVDYLETKIAEQSKKLEEVKSRTGADAIEQYHQQLENTRSEVANNYEQVKGVEKLLSSQSQKMQDVFSQIQNSLAEYKSTSEMLNSTHDAVLRDISSLKAEHEKSIGEYQAVATALEHRVVANARELSQIRNDIDTKLLSGGMKSTSEVEKLRDIFSSQEMALGSLKNDFSSSRSSIDSYLHSLDSRIQSVESHSNEQFSLVAHKGELAAIKEALTLDLENTRRDVTDRLSKSEAKISEGLSVLASLESARSFTENTSAALSSMSAQLEALKGTDSVLEQRISKIDSTVSDAVSRVSSAVLSLESADDKQQRFLEEVKAAAQARLASPDIDLGVLKANVDATTEYSKKLEKVIETQASRIDSLSSEVSGGLNEYRAGIETLKSSRESFMTDIGMIRSEIDSKLAQASQAVLELTTKEDASSAALSTIRRDLDNLLVVEGIKKKIDSYNADMQDLPSLGERVRAMERQVTRIVESEQMLSSMNEEIHGVQSSLVELSKKISSVSEESESYSKALSERTSGFETNLAEAAAKLSGDISSLDTKIEGTQANNSSMFSSIAEGFGKLKSEVGELRSADAAQVTLINELGSREAKLEGAYTGLSSQIERAKGEFSDQLSMQQRSTEEKISSSYSSLKTEVGAINERYAPAIESLNEGVSHLSEARAADAGNIEQLKAAAGAQQEAFMRLAHGFDALTTSVKSDAASAALGAIDSKLASISIDLSQKMREGDSKVAALEARIGNISEGDVANIAKSVSDFAGRMDGLSASNEARFNGVQSNVESRLASMQSTYDSKFNDFATRFDSISAALDSKVADAANRSDQRFTFYDTKIAELNTGISSRVADNSAGIDQLKSSVETLDQGMASLRSELKSSIDAVASRDPAKELSPKLDALGARATSLEESNRALADELNSFRQSSSNSFSDISASSRAGIAEIRATSESLGTKVDSLSTSQGKLASDFSEMRAAINAANMKENELTNSIAQVRTAFENFSQNQTSINGQNSAIPDRIGRLEQATTQSLSDLSQKVNNLLLVQSVTKRLEGETQERSARALEKLKSAERTLDELRPAMVRVERLQQELESERTELREIVRELRSRKTEADASSYAQFYNKSVEERKAAQLSEPQTAQVQSQTSQNPQDAQASAQAKPSDDMDDKLSLLEKTIDEIESNLSETMRSVNDSRPSALEAPRTLERNVEAMGSLLRDFDSPASTSTTARQQEMQPKAPAQRSSESGIGAKIAQDPLKDVGVVSQPLNKSLDSVSTIDAGMQSQSSQSQTYSLSEAGQPIPLSKYGLPAGNPEQAAHTSADRMAMDLMDELRGKFLSDKPAKKEQEKSE